jgi:serine/threonine-protein kinase RsbW
LRAEPDRMRRGLGGRSRKGRPRGLGNATQPSQSHVQYGEMGGSSAGAAVAEVRLACDVHAPAAARAAVSGSLRDRAPTAALQDAQLLVSELVSNSVRHSGASADEAVMLRIGLTPTMVRLEVEDTGCGGVIAPRPPSLDNGGGYGLNLVQALSERWGSERVARGGTRVWAQLDLNAHR